MGCFLAVALGHEGAMKGEGHLKLFYKNFKGREK